MPIVADASVAIRGDLRKFSGDLKKAEGQTKNLGSKLDSALNPKSLLLGVGGGFAVAKIVDFLGDTVAAASNLNETISATSVILGEEALPQLEAWAETAADSFGQSKRQALDGANTFATFGKSAGLAGDDLVGFSTDLTELASDLASFKNTSPEEAITAIGAALRGESEPIRKYGVLLDDATLRQRALKLGIIETTKEALTPQQRVLAAQAEIFAQTNDAQGDFARTSDGLANTQRILTANWENMQAEIGEKLLPVILKLAKFTNDVLIPVFGGLIDVLSEVGGAVGDAVHIIDLGLKTLHLKESTVKQFGTTWEKTGEVIKTAGEEFGTAADDAGENIGEAMDAAADILAEKAEVIVGKFGEIPEDGADAMLAEQWRLKDAMTQLIEVMENALTPAEEMAELEGFLTSKRLAHALVSNNPLIRQKAKEMRDAATARLSELRGLGYTAGFTLAESLARGITAGTGLARDAAGELTRRIGGHLPASEPKDPKSGLRGITKVGGNIVRLIRKDLLANLDLLDNPMSALTNLLSPSSAMPALAMGSGTLPSSSSGGGGGMTINNYLPGRTRMVTGSEIAADMRLLGESGILKPIPRRPPND